jgi:phosphopantetheine--protein transferase-like protein
MRIDGIDLWQFSLDRGPDSVEEAARFLSGEEQGRLGAFKVSRLAAAFATRRAARRIIFGHYLGVPPRHVEIREDRDGKPFLPGLQFSASHSAGRGILAVATQFPVGADIEHVREIDAGRLTERILSPSERERFQTVPQDQRLDWIFSVWTGKEAVVKALGIGLDLGNLPLIDFAGSANPQTWRPVILRGCLEEHGSWILYSPPVSMSYHISLAAPVEAAITEIDASEILGASGI